MCRGACGGLLSFQVHCWLSETLKGSTAQSRAHRNARKCCEWSPLPHNTQADGGQELCWILQKLHVRQSSRVRCWCWKGMMDPLSCLLLSNLMQITSKRLDVRWFPIFQPREHGRSRKGWVLIIENRQTKTKQNSLNIHFSRRATFLLWYGIVPGTA